MKPEKDSKIEELLNSYIDGELSPEECAQVEQLVSSDASIASQLKALERCKLLVSSLPPAEPPAYLVSGIKELLQNRLVTGDVEHIERRRGRRHLFTRQLMAASLMIGLLGIMAAVVYKIVGPERQVSPTVAVQPQTNILPARTNKVVVAKPQAADMGLYSLQLQTSDFVAVDAFVNKLLDESSWLKYEATRESPGRSVYRVLCSKGGLEALVADLSTIWSKFDSATLVVRTDDAGQYATVTAVKPEQIPEIVNQDTPDGRIRLAKDFAVLNNIEMDSPGRNVMAFVNRDYSEMTGIPKPVLTSGAKRAVNVPAGAMDRVRVDLNIVVSAHK